MQDTEDPMLHRVANSDSYILDPASYRILHPETRIPHLFLFPHLW